MILLDTHVAVLLALQPERLSRNAARAIRRAEHRDGVALASISLWEVAQLVDAGRISVRGSVEAFLTQLSRRAGVSVLEITPEIAALAIQVPPDFPGDPADRIIAATSRAHGIPLVTKDAALQDSELVETIW